MIIYYDNHLLNIIIQKQLLCLDQIYNYVNKYIVTITYKNKIPVVSTRINFHLSMILLFININTHLLITQNK